MAVRGGHVVVHDPQQSRTTVFDTTGKIAAYELDVTVESAATDRLEVNGMLAIPLSDGTERPVVTAQTAQTFDA